MFLYYLSTNTLTKLEIPNVYPAQPNFHPNSSEFVFIGYEKTLYKLGLSGMLNRKTNLYIKSIFSDTIIEIKMHSKFMAGLFPKFSPNGLLISYFAVPADSLSHCMCLALIVYNIETMENTIVLDVIEEYNESFNGIYGYHDH